MSHFLIDVNALPITVQDKIILDIDFVTFIYLFDIGFIGNDMLKRQHIMHGKFRKILEKKYVRLLMNDNTLNKIFDVLGTIPMGKKWENNYRNTLERIIRFNLHDPCKLDMGKNILIISAMRGHSKIVKILLKYCFGEKQYIDIQDNYSMTALMYSCRNNISIKHNILRYLTLRKCNFDLQEINGKTALMMAEEKNNNESVRKLLSMGADANVVDITGYTLMANFCSEYFGKDENIGACILINISEFDKKESKLNIALSFAIAYRRTNIIRMILAICNMIKPYDDCIVNIKGYKTPSILAKNYDKQIWKVMEEHYRNEHGQFIFYKLSRWIKNHCRKSF
jgi:hypothetical protein